MAMIEAPPRVTAPLSTSGKRYPSMPKKKNLNKGSIPPIPQRKKNRKMAKAVQQMKYDETSYQLIDPKNGPVAVIVHRGVALPKDSKEIHAKNLCFHRVVANRNEWITGAGEKKRKPQDPRKARYVRTVRTVVDGKSVYRTLTKAQMRTLYGSEATKDVYKLKGDHEIPIYDRPVRNFLKSEAERKRKRKEPKKPKESPPTPGTSVVEDAAKAAKKAKLLAQLAELETD